MTAIVLPLGNTATFDELRYALRGADKHLSASDVYIVGEQVPEWYVGEYIYCKQGKDRWRNTSDALLAARDNLGDVDVLYYNDDFFAMSESSIAVLGDQTWHKGSVMDLARNNRKASPYRHGAVDVLKLLGDDILNYEHHIPLLINLDLMADAIGALRWHGCSEAYKRSAYCHLTGVGDGYGYRDDVKGKDIPANWPGDWLSTSNGSWAQGSVGTLVRNVHAQPSRWEVEDE